MDRFNWIPRQDVKLGFMAPLPKTFGAGGIVFSSVSVREWVYE